MGTDRSGPRGLLALAMVIGSLLRPGVVSSTAARRLASRARPVRVRRVAPRAGATATALVAPTLVAGVALVRLVRVGHFCVFVNAVAKPGRSTATFGRKARARSKLSAPRPRSLSRPYRASTRSRSRRRRASCPHACRPPACRWQPRGLGSAEQRSEQPQASALSYARATRRMGCRIR